MSLRKPAQECTLHHNAKWGPGPQYMSRATEQYEDPIILCPINWYLIHEEQGAKSCDQQSRMSLLTFSSDFFSLVDGLTGLYKMRLIKSTVLNVAFSGFGVIVDMV
jgi:hypothetical protein